VIAHHGTSAAIECAVTALALRDRVSRRPSTSARRTRIATWTFVPGKARPASFSAALSSSLPSAGQRHLALKRRDHFSCAR
jgi:hypothetical protein